MKVVVRLRTTAAMMLALAACAQSSPPKSIDDREAAAMAPLRNRYKDLVMGTDVKGANLSVYIDVNSLYSMEKPDEDAFKSDVLQRWKRTWSVAHPHHKRTTLRVAFRDYYGREISAVTAKL